jgi:hypothetical protein
MHRTVVALVLMLVPLGEANAALIQLDSNDCVVGVFANPQPGIEGIQNVSDNDPRLVAFQSAMTKSATQYPPDRLSRLC